MEIKKISNYIWKIEKEGRMRVPVEIFSSEKLLEKMKKDKTLEQAKNVASLRGIIKKSIVLPDAHEGYGFPIGGVAAFDINEGIISPGGVGYDINCSVRLLRTNLNLNDLENKKKKIIESLFRVIPSGVGEGGAVKFSKEELKKVLEGGAQFVVKKGFGYKKDYLHTEEEGCMKDASSQFVSDKAIARGLPQLGSLGAGNHFLEVQFVEQIYNNEIAEAFGLHKGQITIMIHCGSRGLGHQVASDYIKLMEEEYGFSDLPDRELVNAPIKSDLGRKYYKAMAAAANFAFANKQIITHFIRESISKIFQKFEAEVVYDVCHNIAKFEEHEVDGEKMKLCVHRKGATRAFGAGRKEIPETYRQIGQPIIIPGSMGTASYVLVGTKKAEEITFASTAHGAGRIMSRNEALKSFRGENIKKQLEENKIEILAGSWKSIAEEAPAVYKDIDEVVSVSNAVGIGSIVAKLRPLAVMKG